SLDRQLGLRFDLLREKLAQHRLFREIFRTDDDELAARRSARANNKQERQRCPDQQSRYVIQARENSSPSPQRIAPLRVGSVAALAIQGSHRPPTPAAPLESPPPISLDC